MAQFNTLKESHWLKAIGCGGWLSTIGFMIVVSKLLGTSRISTLVVPFGFLVTVIFFAVAIFAFRRCFKHTIIALSVLLFHLCLSYPQLNFYLIDGIRAKLLTIHINLGLYFSIAISMLNSDFAVLGVPLITLMWCWQNRKAGLMLVIPFLIISWVFVVIGLVDSPQVFIEDAFASGDQPKGPIFTILSGIIPMSLASAVFAGVITEMIEVTRSIYREFIAD